ncbi:tryptophan--tRNA ligase, mitochondrial-like [Styela clava]
MLRRTHHRFFRKKLLHRITTQRRNFSEDVKESPKVVFSGIQPTGIPHLGNYLGAIKQWVDLQKEENEIYFSIVDLHALTIPHEEKICEKVLSMVATLLACGIDPKRSIVFKQSEIKEHVMLSWLLSCIVQQNTLKNMIQWKEKSKSTRNAANLGLFTYPVLQCADILLYKATHVPVGNDQTQHLELCQDIARKFNNRFGTFFPEPVTLIDENCTKILSLRDPFSKMSKSQGHELSRINLDDSDDQIWNKIKKAVTDNTSAVTYDPIRRPGVANLIQIHSSMTDLTVNEICSRSEEEGLDTGQYKMAVAEAVIDHIRPIRAEYEKLVGDREHLETVLSEGTTKAKETAQKNWNELRSMVGLT